MSSQLYMAANSSASLGAGKSKLVLLLLGERLTGKSSAGNSILGRTEFETGTGTTRSSKQRANIFGKQVTVVDTPGWTSWRSTPDRISRELHRGLALCHPGLHAILLVLPTTGTFSQGEWRAMEAHLRLLQISIWQRAMILFTHGDKIGHMTIQEHIKRQGRTLQWLLERCGNRYHMLGSKSRGLAVQVKELLDKIEKMVEANMRPREVQQRMYSRVREEVRMQERNRGGGREDIEIEVMWDGMQRQTPMASGPSHSLRGFLTGPPAMKPELSLILLGRRMSGKTSAGNIILGKGEFQSGKKTVQCTVGHEKVAGWSVTVVDTPGWSLFGLAKSEQVRLEIERSPSLCPPDSKLTFLLAIPVDSFTEKDRKEVEKYLRVLGDRVWESTVVLFTYGGELRGRTIEKHVEKKGEPLQWVLERCGHRHHVFDSNNTGHQTQVIELLEMAEL